MFFDLDSYQFELNILLEYKNMDYNETEIIQTIFRIDKDLIAQYLSFAPLVSHTYIISHINYLFLLYLWNLIPLH